ncbi:MULTISPECIES: BlaI/MecI/CopY family transcriptional regulator [unclassified Streptomyces]|uniref:BlaI/MecI/CopY family transcriptional regulator n=1 Tax=unclassified Streptomyces TaxID=2593676 RepID=UPI002E2F99E4|nr:MULTISPECIES: BlaI/MecI/CopY family transcriptional regulator [unclassified Streptomyces]WUC63073.1 BlaI/MecI/CopY family transcriptional regulator [Streptomyces sp. NBC_00539]
MSVHEPTPPKRGRGKGELEAEVLDTLHRAAPEALSPGEVKDALGGELSYSTVVTALSRLYAKGLLRRSPRGRAFAYAPIADASGLAAHEMRKVLEGRPDREAVLARFVDDLSDDDEQLLRKLLDLGD